MFIFGTENIKGRHKRDDLKLKKKGRIYQLQNVSYGNIVFVPPRNHYPAQYSAISLNSINDLYRIVLIPVM